MLGYTKQIINKPTSPLNNIQPAHDELSSETEVVVAMKK